MPRKRLPTEYDSPIDLEGIGDQVRAGERPIASALGMLYRSTKISQETIDKVAEHALKGYQWDAIAGLVGVSPRALSGWLRRGKDRREKIDEWLDKRRTIPEDASEEQILQEIGLPPEEDDLLMLYDACARAHANAECRLVDVIRDDAEILKNPKSAMWLLQARFQNWKGNGKLPRYEDSSSSGPVDAVEQLAAKIDAFEARATALAVAATAGS
jgi:transcriptional regulator with XRE-family HTH domain